MKMKHGEGLKSRTIVLPVVVCGFETWSVTLMEENRPRVFENRVLRKSEEVTGQRRLHKENCHLCSSPLLFGSSLQVE